MSRHTLDLDIGQEGQILSGFHVGDLLDETLGEYEVDFLKGALLGLRVEEVDDGEEAGVHHGEEEVRAPAILEECGVSYHFCSLGIWFFSFL